MATNMATNLKPLADRVIVEPLEKDEVTASGIYLPETAKEKPQEGRILAVGPGRLDEDGKRTAMEVSVNDKVIFAKYSGTEIKLDDKKLLILSEKDILAIVTDGKTPEAKPTEAKPKEAAAKARR
jgi:chaperonin GroES